MTLKEWAFEFYFMCRKFINFLKLRIKHNEKCEHRLIGVESTLFFGKCRVCKKQIVKLKK